MKNSKPEDIIGMTIAVVVIGSLVSVIVVVALKLIGWIMSL